MSTALRALVLFALLGVGVARAQDEPMPITVKATPRLALPHSPVKFSGTTVADGKRWEVVLTIRFPASGEHIERRTRVDSSGAYSFTLTTLHTGGDYTVSALAPDGRGKDSTTFTISDVEEVLSDVMDALRDMLEDAKAVELRAAEEVRGLPEAPGKEEMVEKVKLFEDSMRVQPQRLAQFNRALQILQQVRQKVPAADAVFRDFFVHLGEEAFRTQAEADARKVEIVRELDASRAAGKLCDRLEATSEGFKAVGAILNLGSTVIGIVRNYLVDFAATTASQGPHPLLKDNPQGQLAMSEAVKASNAALQGPTGWVTFAVSFANDLAVYMVDQQFNKYCERFEGPFTATMHGEVFKDGRTWWTMDVRLEGRLTLRYPKSGASQAIHMSGQFEGAATDYKVWDDALPVLFPQLMRGTRTFKRTFVPQGIPYSDFEGRYAAMASPTAFMIPVEGDLVGRKLTIRLQPAKREIPREYATARVVVAILSPLALIPAVTSYTLPYQNAEFVLKHGMELDEGAPLALDITLGRNSMQAQRQWQRTKPGDGVKAIYTATLRLCNPSCQ